MNWIDEHGLPNAWVPVCHFEIDALQTNANIGLRKTVLYKKKKMEKKMENIYRTRMCEIKKKIQKIYYIKKKNKLWEV